MALVGHTAASMNIFLDIPFFLRGLSQSLYGSIGPNLRIGQEVIDQIKQVDPLDPTRVVDKYLDDWWNYEAEWETHSAEVDHEGAYQWHVKEVSKRFYIIPWC
jgi:hypothetical protein